MFRTTSRTFCVSASAAVLVCVAATLAEAATVSGNVVDSTTSLPLSGVEVLVDGVPSGVTTDLMGQFKAEVGEGERLFTFKRTGFSEQSIGPVTVTAEGETAVPPAKLAPDSANDIVMLDALDVTGDLVANSVVTVRQQADVSVDLLSADDFGKFTGTDVADIVVRIPGLSTTSRGTFAVVRGLSERYNPVMLDGIVLPSSDPERQSPELDIFPNKLVDAIVISKAYEPRLPGTASGAAIDLRTKPLPEGRKTEITVGLRFDGDYFTNENFYQADGVGGSTGDFFGLGASSRNENAPGSNVPDTDANQQLLNQLRNDYIKSENTTNGLSSGDFPLGGRFSFTHEDRILLNEETGRAFGYTFSYSQDRTASSESGTRLKPSEVGPAGYIAGTAAGINEPSYNEYEDSELEHRWGLLGSTGYAFNENHAVNVSIFWSQIGLERYSRETNGLSAEDFPSLETAISELETRPGQFPRSELNVAGLFGQDEIYYRQRHLIDLKAGGEHKIPAVSDTKVTWTIAQLEAEQQEPEYLAFPYRYGETSFGLTSYSVGEYTRYWRETKEDTVAGRVDLETPMEFSEKDFTARYGYYFDRTERAYNEDSFSLSAASVTGFSFDQLLYELSAPENTFSTIGFGRPFADAERTIDAGYLSGTFELLKDKPAVKKLELMAGFRLENYTLASAGRGKVGNVGSDAFYQALTQAETGVLPAPRGADEYSSTTEETDVLPALALNYATGIQGLNLRLAFSETRARPSFREVGNYFTIDRVSDEFIHGNDTLVTSKVTSYDFRAEYFSSGSQDSIALSLFRKNITDPIERISVAQLNLGSISTFFNNENEATLNGVEFEFTKSLSFLGEAFSGFTFGGNYTFIAATVDRDSRFERRKIDPAFDGDAIPDDRQLYDQPEFIMNAYLGYELRPWGLNTTLSYFAISDTLLKVNELYWDTYTEGFSRWDLTFSKKFGDHLKASVSARNLLDPERRQIADPNATRETIVYRSYRDGRSYTISLSYEF